MSELDISAIQARVEAATPPRWHAEVVARFFSPDGHKGKEWFARIPRLPDKNWMIRVSGEVENKTDRPAAEFIAHARTDVPMLLEALAVADALQARIKRLEDVRTAAEIVRKEWHDRGDGGCELRIRNVLVAALDALAPADMKE